MGGTELLGKLDFYMPVDQCRFDGFVSYVILDDKAGPENFYVHIVGFDNEWLIFFVEDFEIGLPVEPDFSFFIRKTGWGMFSLLPELSQTTVLSGRVIQPLLPIAISTQAYCSGLDSLVKK